MELKMADGFLGLQCISFANYFDSAEYKGHPIKDERNFITVPLEMF